MTETVQGWYVYMVRCRDGSLYTGITTDVARRFTEHRKNSGTGAKYLRGRGPLLLVFQQKIGSRSLALSVENRVKKLSRVRKENLIKTGIRIDRIIKQDGV
jgi:putative endonuclease